VKPYVLAKLRPKHREIVSAGLREVSCAGDALSAERALERFSGKISRTNAAFRNPGFRKLISQAKVDDISRPSRSRTSAGPLEGYR